MPNHQYMIYGDLSSDSADDNYPLVTLCEECVAEVDVVTENGISHNDCEHCGAESGSEKDESAEDDPFEE